MSFKKISALLLVAVLAAGVFGCKKKEEAKEAAAPAAAPAGNTIKIGFLGALTGDVAMFGKPTLEGMKMAADEINAAGGVKAGDKTFKVELLAEDDKAAPTEGSGQAAPGQAGPAQGQAPTAPGHAQPGHGSTQPQR